MGQLVVFGTVRPSAGVPIGDDRDLTAEARIRRAALALFATQGYDRTTTRAIAAKAGVSHGLVLHHFGSKDRLREQVDADVMATLDGIFSPIVPDQDGPADMEVWRDGFRAMFRDHEHVTAYLRRSLLQQTDQAPGLFEPLMGYAERLLETLVARGAARPPADIKATTAVVAGMALTSVLLGRELERYVGDGEPLETRLAKAELELLVLGLFRPEGA